jgi:hypothetical protein
VERKEGVKTGREENTKELRKYKKKERNKKHNKKLPRIGSLYRELVIDR